MIKHTCSKCRQRFELDPIFVGVQLHKLNVKDPRYYKAYCPACKTINMISVQDIKVDLDAVADEIRAAVVGLEKKAPKKEVRKKAAKVNPITINQEMIGYFSKYVDARRSGINLERTDILEKMSKLWQALLGLNIRYEEINWYRRETGERDAIGVFSERDTMHNRFAICTEYSYLYIAAARHFGLDCRMVDVRQPVNEFIKQQIIPSMQLPNDLLIPLFMKMQGCLHAVAAVIIDDRLALIDPTRKLDGFACSYPAFKLLDDIQMAAIHLSNSAYCLFSTGHHLEAVPILEEAEYLYRESLVIKGNLVHVLSKIIQTPENKEKLSRAIGRLRTSINSLFGGEVDFHVPAEVIEYAGKPVSLYAI